MSEHVTKLPLRWDRYDGVVRDAENWVIQPQELMRIANQTTKDAERWRFGVEKASVPCFCWAHHNMIEDAMMTAENYAHEALGLMFGAIRRRVLIKRNKVVA